MTYVLFDVGVSRPGTTNADADVIVTKVLLGQLAHVLVEGGGEEKVAMITILIGVWDRSAAVRKRRQENLPPPDMI